MDKSPREVMLSFSDKFERLSKEFGVKVRTTIPDERSELFHKGDFNPDIIYAVRSLIFQLISVSNSGRMQHHFFNKRWLLASQAGCNQGFIISRIGLGIVYHTDCHCLTNYFQDPDNFQCIIFDDDGSQMPINGFAVSRGDDNLHRLESSNAYLVQWELPPHKATGIHPRLRSTPMVEGETVFSVGLNRNQWVVTAGQVTSIIDGSGEIETDIDCFHGFCGSPLIDAEGRICGHGAEIRYHDRTPKNYPKRKYGLGCFDDIQHLMKNIDTEKAGLVWA